jgi:cell division protein FtsI/penicillin-binding protein 2
MPETGTQNTGPGGKLERVYPLGETAANLVGFLSPQEAAGRRPVSGLELGIDSVLKHGDARLTIDTDLQRVAFQALQRCVSTTRAARASAVAMPVATSEILALADYPGYDPTRARMYPSEVWLCHAVTDEFAPGPLSGDWWLKTEGGTRVAEELGFGRPAGIGLPDETVGVLADSLSATRVSLLQLVQAYSVIADEGRMNRPRLVAPSAASRKPQAMSREQGIERTFAAQCLASMARDTEGGMEFLGAGGIAGPDSLSPVLVFVGVFPAGEPKYVVGVMLDRPLAGYYTPETARLLFEDIARCVSGQ